MFLDIQGGIHSLSEAQRTQNGWHEVALSQVKKLASSLARHTGQVEKEVTGQVAISSPAALSSFKREQPPSPQQGSQSDVTGAV